MALYMHLFNLCCRVQSLERNTKWEASNVQQMQIMLMVHEVWWSGFHTLTECVCVRLCVCVCTPECVTYLSSPEPKHYTFPSCREVENEAVLRWDVSLVAVVITSNCWVITAPQAAWLNVFWLNTNDWLCICPCGNESGPEHCEKSR